MVRMQALRMTESGYLDPVTWDQSACSLSVESAPVEPVALSASVAMWGSPGREPGHRSNRPALRLARLHGAAVHALYGPVLLTGARDEGITGLTIAEAAWLRAWVGGRCTSIDVRDGVAASCGAVQSHDGITHEALVAGRRWLWNGPAARWLGGLDVVEDEPA